MFKKRNTRRFNYKSAVIKRTRPHKKRVLFVKRVRNVFSSKIYIMLGIFLASAIGVGYFLFFTNHFLITDIKIGGVSESTQKEIIEYYNKVSQQRKFFILKQNKTVSFSAREFEKNILFELPKIKKIEIKIKMPHTLNMEAQERAQEGIWCAYAQMEAPQCFFYDSSGIVYEEAPNSVRGSLIKVIRDSRVTTASLGSAVMSLEILEYVNDLIESLGTAYERPSYILIKNNDEISAGFSLGWEAQFSRGQNLIESVENLTLILNEEIGSRIGELLYIDLRLGNKAFYKWQGGAE